ncbi:MAG: baseplate J/gp47 family protein [Firmicutes bacterium]|nr:baseplate J/gp47 family protein [Bacillota bacterium]
MFENMTAEYFLQQALANVSDKLDKREGAIIYDTLAPFCNELARAYADLELVLMQLFPQTAARKYLLLLAQQRGFEPKAASALEIKAHFNVDVPIESRFNMEQYNYTVTEALGGGMYRLVCETAGSAPNSALGTLTPINYISGLTECTFIGILKEGTDEEDTEDFRKRFIDSISDTQPFGGNISDYKKRLKAMDGIGQVKVFAADDWLGAGTVGIFLTNADNEPVTQEFAADIKNMLDPYPNGTGLGMAPVGHIVSVSPARSAGLTVSISITSDGSSGGIEERARAVTANYFKKQNQKWETRNVSVYASGIVAELMDIDGVADAQAEINGGASYTGTPYQILSAANVEVDIDEQ